MMIIVIMIMNWFEVWLRNKNVLNFPEILIITNVGLQGPWVECEWNLYPESIEWSNNCTLDFSKICWNIKIYHSVLDLTREEHYWSLLVLSWIYNLMQTLLGQFCCYQFHFWREILFSGYNCCSILAKDMTAC